MCRSNSIAFTHVLRPARSRSEPRTHCLCHSGEEARRCSTDPATAAVFLPIAQTRSLGSAWSLRTRTRQALFELLYLHKPRNVNSGSVLGFISRQVRRQDQGSCKHESRGEGGSTFTGERRVMSRAGSMPTVFYLRCCVVAGHEFRSGHSAMFRAKACAFGRMFLV